MSEYDPYWDQPPYAMIGVMTTLPRDENDPLPDARPIGFIWPKSNSERRDDVRTPRPQSGRGSSQGETRWQSKPRIRMKMR